VKKLIYAIGLIFPAIATKAIAQQMKLPALHVPERLQGNSILESNLSSRELETIDLYENCSPRERAVFLFKVLATLNGNNASSIDQMILQQKIDQVLILPEEEQKEQLIEMIRNGGLRWGSIGKPTEATST
jgi:hypothetical protein